METRFEVYTAIGFLLVLDCMITLVGWLRLRTFTSDHSSITSDQDFDAFKRLAKSNMYMALGIIALVMAGLTVLAVGLFKGGIGILDIGVVAIGFSFFSHLTAKTVTGLEARSKSLPVEGQQRTDAYNEIIRKWTNDLFPDW